MGAMQVLGGRYRLEERIGRGGMSVVWRAHDEVLGRPVAVKLLEAPLGVDAAARLRIRAEARAAARLSHPHVTSVHDYGESVDESGEYLPFVVMELLTGPTLSQRLAEGPVAPALALRICAEIASGLAAAHDEGVVHRDVKPANVVLTSSGAKVLDFGIAAAVGPPEDADPDSVVFGTPEYLAPERLTNGAVLPASDVYAVGLLLYRMLSGGHPWQADTITEQLRAHIHVPPAPLPPIDGVPAQIRLLCQRCLAKDPTARPAAHEVAALLADAAGITLGAAGDVVPATTPRPAGPASGAAAGAGTPLQPSAAAERRPPDTAADADLPATADAPAGTELPADRDRSASADDPGVDRGPDTAGGAGAGAADQPASADAPGSTDEPAGPDGPRTTSGPGSAGRGPAYRSPPGGGAPVAASTSEQLTAPVRPPAAAAGPDSPPPGGRRHRYRRGVLLGVGAAAAVAALAGVLLRPDRGPDAVADGAPPAPVVATGTPAAVEPTTGGVGTPSPDTGASPTDRAPAQPASADRGPSPTVGAADRPAAAPPPPPSVAPTGTATAPPPAAAPPPTATPTGAPTPTAGGPAERTLTSAGGTVVAACTGGRATALRFTPADGYEVRRAESGPARLVRVVFEAGDEPVRMLIRCVDGVPRSTNEISGG